MNASNSGEEERARAEWDAYDQARARYEKYEKAKSFYRSRRYQEALQIYLSLASRDSANGELLLQIGSMYYKGLGTSKDPKEAEQWIGRAVELGSPAARYYLAVIRSHQGRYAETIELLERAAAYAYAPAIYRLGVMYELGDTFARDRVKAYELFARAGAMGHVLAQRQIAVSLMRGERGLLLIPKGLLMIVKALVNFIRFYVADPGDERLQA